MRHSALIIILLILGGCATKFSDGTNTVATIDINVAASDKNYYRVYSGNHLITAAYAQNGKLVFQLPDQEIASCVAVIDPKGNSMFKDRELLFPAVRYEYQQTYNKRRAAKGELDDAIRSDPTILLNATNARLRANRAYNSSSCVRPIQLPIPSRPSVRCGNRQECLQDGAAICFTMYLGAKGCGKAFSELRIPGLLSSPGCAAAAAKLAGEKYDLGDAVTDAILGMIDDAASDLKKSRDLGDNILGHLISLGSEAYQLSQAQSCTNSFVDRQFAPLQNWLTRVDEIRSEPDQLLSSCQRDIQSAAYLFQQIPTSSNRISALQSSVDTFDAKLQSLAKERRPLQWCQAKS